MITTWLQFNLGPKEERWAQMMILSFVFHLAIFFGSIFISKNTIYYPSFEEHVYHVELVAPPQPGPGGGTKGVGVATGKGPGPIVKAKTRRITVKEKPPATVVAKRVSPKPSSPPPRKKEVLSSDSELIDGAISRVEKTVELERKQLEESISRIEKRLESKKKEQPQQQVTERTRKEARTTPKRSGGGLAIGSSGIGKGIQLYQLQIEAAIKRNWSYPVALINAREGKAPKAVISLSVRSDGKILKAEFKKKSWDPLFNDSVLKALERSDPLPKFPPGYMKSRDEVEIRFSLKDLIR
jgi:colicin import membrane protein